MLEIIRQHYKKILVILLIVVVSWFINLVGTDKDYNWLEGLIIDLLHPVLKVVEVGHDWLKRTVRVIINYREVKHRNHRLQEKLANLKYHKHQMTKIMMQNYRLRKLLNFKEYVPYQVVGASVIGYSPDNWTSGILINRGTKAEIVSKMPVVAEAGYLAGVIQKSSSYTSQVTLLNDPEFIIGGLVRRKESRALGVVKGQGKQENKLIMDNISWNADIKSQDIIVTSGLSNQVPKGLPIGKVISVTPDNYGLTQTAILKPFVNLSSLEEVLVITNYTAKTERRLPPLKAYPSLN